MQEYAKIFWLGDAKETLSAFPPGGEEHLRVFSAKTAKGSDLEIAKSRFKSVAALLRTTKVTDK